MNRIYMALLIALLAIANVIQAQCTDKGISTDPRNPVNTEKPSAKNQFFWFPHNGNNHSQISMRLSGTPTQDIQMNNPFWQASSNSHMFESQALQQLSDFYPDDGWELIKSDFGYLADGSTLRNSLPSMTYFCMYNRYTATMRFFGALPTIPGTHHIVNWEVRILTHKRGTSNPTTTNTNLDGSNLLSVQGESIGALDQETDEVSMNVMTQFPGTSPGGYFFWFDIPVAYDPCICYNDVAIEMSGKLIQNFDFTASGSLLGTIQETKKPSGANYDKLVFDRVIGAGFALGTALATGGSVIQVSKFTSLLDLIINKPGIGSSDKKQLEMFKKFLDSSDKLLRKDGKWVDWVTKDTLKDKDVIKMMTGINTYASSIMNLGKKGGGDKAVTTIHGKINLTGSVSGEIPITQSPYWAAPGSDWATDCSEEVTPIPNGGGQKYPEYPLYNEALGTFALLKTPKLKLNITRIWEHSINQFIWEPDPMNPGMQRKSYWSCDGFKVQGYLPEDLNFVINPALNLNWDKSKISAVVSVELEQDSTKGWSWEMMNADKIPFQFKISMNGNAIEDKNPINMEAVPGDSNTFVTTPVDLDEFREVFFQGRFIARDYSSFVKPLNPSSVHDIRTGFAPKVYLKLYCEFESNDIGRDGTPVKFTQVLSLPYDDVQFTDDFPLPKLNTRAPKGLINLDQFGGTHFTTNQTIFADTINISSNLSAAPGITVRIIATKKINVSPGVLIGRGIELIVIENPFSGLFPQDPKNSAYVASYCQGNTSDATYKADEWSSTVFSPSTGQKLGDILDSSIPFEAKVYPNPTTGKVLIKFEGRETIDIQVFDTNGKSIYSSNSKDRTSWHDLTSLAKGVYLIVLTAEDGARSTKKLVKQ